MNTVTFVTSSLHSNMLYVGWALPRQVAQTGHPLHKLTAKVDGVVYTITYVSGSDARGYYLTSKGSTFNTGLLRVELTW